MATPLGAMRIELELDSSKFASNLNASKKAVNYFKAEAMALDAAMKSSGNTMTFLGAKQKTLTQALDKQGISHGSRGNPAFWAAAQSDCLNALKLGISMRSGSTAPVTIQSVC